ncbi:polyprenol monophosphomannose synthase [Desulforhopalus sp. IMCC35007]|uniref:polyprenol monophosphomannose synthase n=1 Tax=Desulforhopalus sp. IMCC35007 TaxID=2569543 RepID=UPI0010ADB81E|nr:polyprenol monophosphomannose synthase [Desulforhopalus sp. IMCC35007]TKB09435.1 polyprenol monophosphomannose synthase [Desulforhopalus sp. IMCC35007]
MAKITIIIPTLNEEENIDFLLERIFKVKDSSGLDFDVLFVDSASIDGTSDCIKKWQGQRPVKLLQREVNVGLAPAVIAGAHFVDSEYVLVMDADLSHPPEKIPELLAPLLSEEYDMVIGSRYVDGGATPDWPFSRKLSSKLATLPALCFCSAKDPLAGFFALKRRLITDLSLHVPGFKIGFAILAEYNKKIRIKEIPIQFRDRDFGQSKMGKGVIYDYLRQLAGLMRTRMGF